MTVSGVELSDSLPIMCIPYFKLNGQADVRELCQCLADAHCVIFFLSSLLFFSPGVLSKDFFWLCNEENSNLQQVALKAYSIGLVFKSLLGSEFEPLPHICSFIIYDVL